MAAALQRRAFPLALSARKSSALAGTARTLLRTGWRNNGSSARALPLNATPLGEASRWEDGQRWEDAAAAFQHAIACALLRASVSTPWAPPPPPCHCLPMRPHTTTYLYLPPPPYSPLAGRRAASVWTAAGRTRAWASGNGALYFCLSQRKAWRQRCSFGVAATCSRQLLLLCRAAHRNGVLRHISYSA